MRQHLNKNISWEKILYRLPRLLSEVCLWASGVFLLLNVINIVFGIFTRYVIKFSFIWTEEFSRYSLIWSVMLASVPALYYGDHMYIDFLLKRAKGVYLSFLIWFKRIVVGIVLILLVYYGVKYTYEVRMFITMAMNISKAIPVAAIPVGSFLLLVEFLLLELFGGEKER